MHINNISNPLIYFKLSIDLIFSVLFHFLVRWDSNMLLNAGVFTLLQTFHDLKSAAHIVLVSQYVAKMEMYINSLPGIVMPCTLQRQVFLQAQVDFSFTYSTHLILYCIT